MLKKNDFVEIDFVARMKETEKVFDTTLFEEAKKADLLGPKDEEQGKEARDTEKRFKPFRLCIGHGMLITGLDNALEGKELGKWQEVELQPKEAFGLRDPKLVKIFSLSAFRERGINPVTGMMLTLDNMLVRIASVSGGRVIVDFNNPLAGRVVVYRFRINKKIEDRKEKLDVLAGFFLGKPEKLKIEGKDKKAVLEFKVKIPDKIKEDFCKKVKDVLGVDAEVKEVKEAKEAKGIESKGEAGKKEEKQEGKEEREKKK